MFLLDLIHKFLKTHLKKISLRLDRVVFLVVPLILFIAALLPNMYESMVERGEISLSLLYWIIFMKPVLVILWHPIKNSLLHFRRHLGMLCFWFALFHTGGIIWIKWRWDVSIYLWSMNYLFWWALAMIGMLILWLTSNYKSIRLLKKNRKRIQYLAYPVLFMTLLHEAFIPSNQNKQGFLALLPVIGILLIFLIAKFIQRKVEKKEWKTALTYLATLKKN